MCSQLYPEEGISRILQNVFDFDQYEREVKDLLIRTLQKHGIPVGLESDFKLDLGIEVRMNEHKTECRRSNTVQVNTFSRLGFETFETCRRRCRGRW